MSQTKSGKIDYEVALVDADVLRYEMGAITTTHPFLEGERIAADPSFIEQRCVEKIDRIKASTGCKKLIFFFSDKQEGKLANFRFEVAKQQKYKGNRDNLEKPFHWATVDKFIKENYKYVQVFGREADDLLAELQRVKKNTIICTRDKDLLITPGWHYRWSCGDRQPEVLPHYVEEIDAWRNFFYQMLIGDSTDNIAGCGERVLCMWGGKEMLRRKGIGKKEAEKLLEGTTDVESMYHIVRIEYLWKFPDDWEEKMLENARLLFVGQREDDLFDWSWLHKDWDNLEVEMEIR